MHISRAIFGILVLYALAACTRDLPMSVNSPRSHMTDEQLFSGPPPEFTVTAAPGNGSTLRRGQP